MKFDTKPHLDQLVYLIGLSKYHFSMTVNTDNVMKISVLYYPPTFNKGLHAHQALLISLGNWTGMCMPEGGGQRKDGKLRDNVTSWDCKFWESTKSGQEIASHPFPKNL